MGAVPPVRIRHLGGAPTAPLLVVGPSLGTAVETLWGSVAEHLPEWRVLGWDLPGHGPSPAVDPDAPRFSMTDLGAAVLAAVSEAAGGDASFAYAGDSVGGAVGLQLALARPDRVTAVSVWCSAARFGAPEAWHERAALVRTEGMTPIVAASPARWFGTAIRRAGDWRIDAALRDLASIDVEGYARVCEALASYDLTARLAEITSPVLAVAGAEDPVTPPEVLREIADGVPDGKVEVLADVGHLAPYEAPHEVATLLRAHLPSLPRISSPH